MPAFTCCATDQPQRPLRLGWIAMLLGAVLLTGCATPRTNEGVPAQPPAPIAAPKTPRPAADKPTASPSSAPAPATAARQPDATVQIGPLDGGAPKEPAADTASSPEAIKPGSGQTFAKGLASWYGPRFHGRRTASGERYDMHAFTAAHKTLPFGTKVRVRSVQTGKEVVVRINDRGPYRHQRIIDLSLGAITALGLRHRGVTEVVLLRE